MSYSVTMRLCFARSVGEARAGVGGAGGRRPARRAAVPLQHPAVLQALRLRRTCVHFSSVHARVPCHSATFLPIRLIHYPPPAHRPAPLNRRPPLSIETQ